MIDMTEPAFPDWTDLTLMEQDLEVKRHSPCDASRYWQAAAMKAVVLNDPNAMEW